MATGWEEAKTVDVRGIVNQPFFFLEGFVPAIRVLYGVDLLGGSPDGLVPKKMMSATKNTGAEVPLGYFVEPSMPEISAVMSSNVATASKVGALSAEDPRETVYFSVATMDATGETVVQHKIPKAQYHESVLDGLHFFHNPKAHYHFPRECFECGGLTQWWFDFGKGVLLRIGSPQMLLRRLSLLLRAKK